MKRRALLTAMVILLALAPAAGAQSVPRIGYLLLPPLSDPPSRERQAFLDGLRERGYVPGKTVDIVYRSAQNEEVFLGDMCQELIEARVRVIVAAGGAAVLAAKKCTQKVPIVGADLGDPAVTGAVKSFARPEGNLTGVSFISGELAAKRLQLIRELLPAAKTVAVLWNARLANSREETKFAMEAAQRIGLQAASFPVASPVELRRALSQIQSSRPSALYVTVDAALIAEHRTHLAQFGREQRIPLVSGWSFLTEAGGLISYAPDYPAMFRRMSSYVDRILKGATPAELPIERATTVELVINLATAKALGLNISHGFLVRADRVIQ